MQCDFLRVSLFVTTNMVEALDIQRRAAKDLLELLGASREEAVAAGRMARPRL